MAQGPVLTDASEGTTTTTTGQASPSPPSTNPPRGLFPPDSHREPSTDAGADASLGTLPSDSKDPDPDDHRPDDTHHLELDGLRAVCDSLERVLNGALEPQTIFTR